MEALAEELYVLLPVVEVDSLPEPDGLPEGVPDKVNTEESDADAETVLLLVLV